MQPDVVYVFSHILYILIDVSPDIGFIILLIFGVRFWRSVGIAILFFIVVTIVHTIINRITYDKASEQKSVEEGFLFSLLSSHLPSVLPYSSNRHFEKMELHAEVQTYLLSDGIFSS